MGEGMAESQANTVFTSPAMSLQDEILNHCNESLRAMKLMLLEIMSGKFELVKPYLNVANITMTMITPYLEQVDKNLSDNTMKLIDDNFNNITGSGAKILMKNSEQQTKLCDDLMSIWSNFNRSLMMLGVGIVLKVKR